MKMTHQLLEDIMEQLEKLLDVEEEPTPQEPASTSSELSMNDKLDKIIAHVEASPPEVIKSELASTSSFPMPYDKTIGGEPALQYEVDLWATELRKYCHGLEERVGKQVEMMAHAELEWYGLWKKQETRLEALEKFIEDKYGNEINGPFGVEG